MATRISDLPVHDRPRERLSRLGAGSLSDAELLALVVRSGHAGESATSLGATLLAHTGGLAGLSSMCLNDISEQRGMGLAKAAGLVAAFELGRRAAATPEMRHRIRNAADIVAAVGAVLRDRKREEVFVVVAGPAGRLIRVEPLSIGTSERCLVSVREVISIGLRCEGASIALAHTHPSGNLHPSPEDVRLTRDVTKGAESVGLHFLDHVILAGDRWTSLRNLGLL